MQTENQTMKKIFFYIFGLFIITSCSPSQDVNGDFLLGLDYSSEGGSSGGGQTTSKQLKRMETNMKDEDTGDIENHSYTYSYSGAKLISYKDDSGETTKFDYGSNGKISKVYNAEQVSVFEYTGSNVSKVTTTITGIAKITSTYTFSSAKLSKVVTIQEYSVPFPVKAYLETSYQYQGENVTKSLTKAGVYNPVTGDLEMDPEDKNITYTYDAKKSPYKLLPMEYILLIAGIGPQGGAYLSSNNFEKITIAQGTSSEAMTFSHDYDQDNYPTKSTSGQEYIKYSY